MSSSFSYMYFLFFFLSSLTTIESKNNNEKKETADVYLCVCMQQNAPKPIKHLYFPFYHRHHHVNFSGQENRIKKNYISRKHKSIGKRDINLIDVQYC